MNQKFDVKVTINFTRLYKSKKRIIVLEGSSRSGKTYSIIQYLIYRALTEKLFITVARDKLTWLKGSVLRDFFSILEDHFRLFTPDSFNKSESIYTFDNGSIVSFIGLDEAQKVHGRKQDIVWLNEAMEVDINSFNQLAIRTTKQIILDYNPSSESHWIYDRVCTRDDCDFFHSTYKDNPFLEREVKEEIERLEPTPENIKNGTADETSWKIYGLGVRASPKGLIFPNFTIVKELPPESERKKQGYGLDFGFTNDPTALIHVVLAHGELYLDELIFKRGLTNIINPKATHQASIESEINSIRISKFLPIYADSAEPKSIQDLKNAGFNIKGADKGQDSIINGIDIIKRYKLNVTERSLNLIKELRNYKWQEDKATGTTLNKPIDAFCHGIDSVRYYALMELRQPFFSLVHMQSLGWSVYDDPYFC